MYIYNDWYGYGIQELQENLVCGLSEVCVRTTGRRLTMMAHLLDFRKEFIKKDADLKEIWVIMSGLI